MTWRPSALIAGNGTKVISAPVSSRPGNSRKMPLPSPLVIRTLTCGPGTPSEKGVEYAPLTGATMCQWRRTKKGAVTRATGVRPMNPMYTLVPAGYRAKNLRSTPLRDLSAATTSPSCIATNSPMCWRRNCRFLLNADFSRSNGAWSSAGMPRDNPPAYTGGEACKHEEVRFQAALGSKTESNSIGRFSRPAVMGIPKSAPTPPGLCPPERTASRPAEVQSSCATFAQSERADFEE
jgi:hypothetical protein